MVFACFLDVSNGVSNGQKIIDKKLVKNCSRMIHHFFIVFSSSFSAVKMGVIHSVQRKKENNNFNEVINPARMEENPVNTTDYMFSEWKASIPTVSERIQRPGLNTKNVQNFALRNPEINGDGIEKRQKLIKLVTLISIVIALAVICGVMIPKLLPNKNQPVEDIIIDDSSNSTRLCLDIDTNIKIACEHYCEFRLANNCYNNKYKNKLDYKITVSSTNELNSICMHKIINLELELNEDVLFLNSRRLTGYHTKIDKQKLVPASNNTFNLEFSSDGSVTRTGYEILFQANTAECV